MQTLWAVNPRRKSRKGRKKLSRAQIAAGFGGKAKRKYKRRSKRRGRTAAASAPVVHRRRRRSMRVARRSYRRSRGFGVRGGSVMKLLQAGAIGGVGAIAVDVGMGQLVSVLPENMRSPMTSTGEANLGYFASKLGLSLALGIYGPKLPFVGRYASRMSEGAITVMTAQFLRPIAMQAGMKLGAYFSPAPLQRPQQLQGNRMGAYMTLVRRGGGNMDAGARTATVMNMVKNQRQAA